MKGLSMTGVQLFEKTLEWLIDNYGSFRLFVERNAVWTMQTPFEKSYEGTGVTVQGL